MYNSIASLEKTMGMKIFLLFFSLLLLFNSKPSLGINEEDYEFDYCEGGNKGPEHWGDLKKEWAVCRDGKTQSPIDIKKPAHASELGKLQRRYKLSTAVLQNAQKHIELKWDDGGFLFVNGIEFKLEQCHWHTPSEHTINNKRYDMELHMVHTSPDGRIAVIGALYKLGEPDYFLSKLTNDLGTLALTGASEVPVWKKNPWDTMLREDYYYTYMGSLTTPPCSEGVRWMVIGEIQTVAKWQVELLKAALPNAFKNNSRPLQPKNGRRVEVYDLHSQELKFQLNKGSDGITPISYVSSM